MTPGDAVESLDHPDAEVRKEARQVVLHALQHAPSPKQTPVQHGLALARYVERERVAARLADQLRSVTNVADLPTLLDTHALPGWVHAVARTTIRRWIEEAAFAEAAEGASVCVLWAAQSGDEWLGEFVCDVILKRAASRPHASLRAVLPVLQDAARQRRLKRIRTFFGPLRALQSDELYGKIHATLDKLLPLRDLPIPSGNAPDAGGLPIPSPEGEIAPDDLPSPATDAKARVRR